MIYSTEGSVSVRKDRHMDTKLYKEPKNRKFVYYERLKNLLHSYSNGTLSLMRRISSFNILCKGSFVIQERYLFNNSSPKYVNLPIDEFA